MQTGCKIRASLDEKVPVLFISGELTAEAEEELLAQYFKLPEQSRQRTILDFSETRYINSAGIAVLINIMTRAMDLKHKIEFSGLNTHLKRIIDIVGLGEHVRIFDSLDAALQG